MSTSSLQHSQFKRRQARTRAVLANHQVLPRLSVHRSLRHISAQIIDDNAGRTLVSASDHTMDVKGDKKAAAEAVGKSLAEQAAKKSITGVRFDRGGYKYHGRVAALADAARANGLTF